MTTLKDRISHSIRTVANKFGKVSDSALKRCYDVAIDCRNTFINVLDEIQSIRDYKENKSNFDESLNEDNFEDVEGSNMEFKSWIDDAKETEPEREQKFIDEEVEKVMNNILTSYRKSTRTDESVELNEENLIEPALKSACCKHRYNFDKAKNWILNKGKK